jgi:cytoskeletal protein CcmA (bactofilin family)
MTKNKHKIFSGALQFTVFIGVLIALLLISLMLIQNTHTYFIQQSKATIENIQLTNSGVNFLLNSKNTISDTLEIEDLNDQNQKVEVNLSRWGVYEKAIVKATHRKKIIYKAALIGSQIESITRPSLYLQNNYKPLVIVGRTKIKGLSFLPNKQITPGFIAGISYLGNELIEGVIKNSNKNLPEIDKKYQIELEQLLNQNKFIESDYITQNNNIKFSNSFLKPVKVIYSEEFITLANSQLTGNIIVKSEKRIVISKDTKLKDVILIAPVIEIEDDVIGNFQAIASKKINVGKNCILNYPTALVLCQEKNILQNLSSSEEYQIIISSQSEIRGTILYLKSIKENDFKSQILLDENAIVKGEIYCQGNFELKGKVIGSVFTEQFIVDFGGSIFINHIFNGQIIDDNFPEVFCGILFNDTKKGIAKWMY